MTAGARSGLADRLRAETHAVHRAVERRLLGEGWLDDLVSYCTLVERLYHLHLHVESAAAQRSLRFENLDLAGRSRSQLLRADLVALGTAPERLARRCPPLHLADACEVLGALYVLEGSTVGGQVISRLLANRLGIGSATGASSFNPYGERTSERWDAFVVQLDSWPGDPDRVVAGARHLFGCFDAWVLGTGPPSPAAAP